MKETLIIGIGNSGRQDDGLGWEFLDKIEKQIPENVDLEYRYQLQVEDAELISHYKQVIFVDADINQYEKGFQFQLLKPASNNSISSHQLKPETVLALTQNLYQKFPQCYLLGISGKSFELEIGLTEFAKENLKKAHSFLLES